jgi:hypothetical protein
MISIPAMLIKVRGQLKVQHSFLQKELMPMVQKMYESGDGTVLKEDVDKIRKYYGLAVPAILGEAFAALRQQPLSTSERKTATYLGATTGLFDDFFEKTNLSDAYIRNLYQQPDSYPGINDNERLANICWKEALKGCRNPDLLKTCAGQVHEAQIRSRLQKNGQLDQKQIHTITRDKGGYSVLFYMAMFYDVMPSSDKELFYNVGALLQLENDLFDVYKDSRDAIGTLVTKCESMAQLKATYNEMWEHVKATLSKTAFPPKGKKQFLKMMGALVSRGFVCLEMLAKREQQNSGRFQPEAFTRKELICDMEKPTNILKSMHYYARLI